jgi:glycosyltransferase involved in cell wall biosynthesis
LNPQFAHTLRRVVDQQPFQAAHLTGLASVPLRAALIGIPAVLDVPELASHALHSGQGLAALTTLLDLGRTRRYVAHLGQHVERLIVRNATDAWALRTLAGTLSNGRTAPIHVLSDGVDLAAFTPQPIVREPTRLVVSDIPAAHAEQVAHFIAQVLLQVWQTRTDVQLTLAGIALTPTVRRLGRDSRITLLPHGSDPRPALAQATLACVPPFPSASLPTAALHALAMGTPLLAAASTIPQPGPTDGHDLLLANSAAQYAAQIIALLDDHRYRGRLGRAGRQYVAQHHAWADRAAQLEQIYAAAAGAEIADWRLDLGLYQLRAERW